MTTNKNYDSDFCGSLPLNFVNLIQPYGYLLVLSRNLEIIQASENVAALLGRPVQEIVPSSLASWLEPGLMDQTAESLASVKGGRALLPMRFSGNAAEWLAIVHSGDDLILIELEPVQAGNQFIHVFQHIRPAMNAIDAARTVAEACQVVATELKKLSGFDKVMVYRFDSEWNGTVLAEAMELGMDAYLGLKFPASDVPRQARQLYQKNPYRLIPDREYRPVSLYPVINPVLNSFLDLSDCNLRGVAGVHLEYLANMQVMASMSTRILVDGRLWGLISCHHREARNPGYEMCATFELLSGYVATRIAAIRYREHADQLARMESLRLRLVQAVYSSGSLHEGLMKGPEKITDLLDAGGAVLYSQGGMHTCGNTPSDDQLENLQMWLNSRIQGSVLTIPGLSEVYEDAAEYRGTASGIMVIPMNPDRSDCVVLFRPEAIRTVNWGGNPDEAIQFEEDNKKYHPRNSFRIWKETVRGRARDWSEQELTVAAEMKDFINEYSERDFR